MISDAKTLSLGVVIFADFAPKGRLTRKLTHNLNRAAPMEAVMGGGANWRPIARGVRRRRRLWSRQRPRTPPIPFVAHAPLCHSGVGSAVVLAETGWLRPPVGAELPRLKTQRRGPFERAGLRTASRREPGPGKLGFDLAFWRYPGDKEPAAIIMAVNWYGVEPCTYPSARDRRALAGCSGFGLRRDRLRAGRIQSPCCTSTL